MGGSLCNLQNIYYHQNLGNFIWVEGRVAEGHQNPSTAPPQRCTEPSNCISLDVNLELPVVPSWGLNISSPPPQIYWQFIKITRQVPESQCQWHIAICLSDQAMEDVYLYRTRVVFQRGRIKGGTDVIARFKKKFNKMNVVHWSDCSQMLFYGSAIASFALLFAMSVKSKETPTNYVLLTMFVSVFKPQHNDHLDITTTSPFCYLVHGTWKHICSFVWLLCRELS